MSEEQKSIWELNNIPALEYCTLPRAAELLKCQTEDLIHFAQIGAIDICLKLYSFEAELSKFGYWEGINRWEEKFPYKYLTTYSNKSPLSLFKPKVEPDTTKQLEVKQCYTKNIDSALKKPVICLSGLWAIVRGATPPFFYNRLTNNERIALTTHNILFKEADTELIRVDIDDNDRAIFAEPLKNNKKPKIITKITINDILITRTQIEKIYNSVGGTVPNLINKEIDPDPSERDVIESPTIEVNNNKLGDFLEVLIRSVPELGDAVMDATANQRYTILVAFLEEKQKKGLFTDVRMPVSATIEKYFKI